MLLDPYVAYDVCAAIPSTAKQRSPRKLGVDFQALFQKKLWSKTPSSGLKFTQILRTSSFIRVDAFSGRRCRSPQIHGTTFQ